MDQVNRTHNSTAVGYEGKYLTYTELNKYSKQLSKYLKKVGLGTETLVGICRDCSLEMVIGILGNQNNANGIY